MTDKIKKIIAREGIIIFFIVIGIMVLKWSLLKMPTFWSFLDFGEKLRSVELRLKYTQNIYWVFLLYLFIRFIIWAIRTLKK